MPSVSPPSSPVVDEVDDVTSRDESIPLRREPGRITIGTDPTDDRIAGPCPQGPRPGEPTRGGRPARPGSDRPRRRRSRPAKPAAATCRRPSASACCIAAVFVVAVLSQP